MDPYSYLAVVSGLKNEANAEVPVYITQTLKLY